MALLKKFLNEQSPGISKITHIFFFPLEKPYSSASLFIAFNLLFLLAKF